MAKKQGAFHQRKNPTFKAIKERRWRSEYFSLHVLCWEQRKRQVVMILLKRKKEKVVNFITHCPSCKQRPAWCILLLSSVETEAEGHLSCSLLSDQKETQSVSGWLLCRCVVWTTRWTFEHTTWQVNCKSHHIGRFWFESLEYRVTLPCLGKWSHLSTVSLDFELWGAVTFPDDEYFMHFNFTAL